MPKHALCRIFFILSCSPRPHFKQTPSLTLTSPRVQEQLIQAHSLSEARA